MAVDEPAGGLAAGTIAPSAGPRPLSKAELRAGKPSREAFRAVPRRPIVLVLDDLNGAHNVGTILRLADALLLERVFLCGHTPNPPSHKVTKGSRGCDRWVDWEAAPSAAEVLAGLKGRGYAVVGAELAPASVHYARADYRFPLALVMGSESAGITPAALALADLIVHMPIYGMANSLNVATATAVILYELDRRLTGMPEPGVEMAGPPGQAPTAR